jgi:thioredoxin reductase
MAATIVVGDGPGGLSAALFLAKNGHTVTVYGQDQTPMHHAQLHNYLGLPDISGSEFQRTARGQAMAHGATIIDEAVTAIEVVDDQVTVRLASSPPARPDATSTTGTRHPSTITSTPTCEAAERAVPFSLVRSAAAP